MTSANKFLINAIINSLLFGSLSAISNANAHYMPIVIGITDTSLIDTKALPNVWYWYSVTAMSNEYIESQGAFETSEIMTLPIKLAMRALPNKIETADGSVKIVYTLSGLSSALMTVRIYSSASELVRILIQNQLIYGDVPDTIVWDGKSDRGELVPSGIYLVHIAAGPIAEIKKVAVIR